MMWCGAGERFAAGARRAGLWAGEAGLCAAGAGLWAGEAGLCAGEAGLWAAGAGLWAGEAGLCAAEAGLCAAGAGLWAGLCPEPAGRRATRFGVTGDGGREASDATVTVCGAQGAGPGTGTLFAGSVQTAARTPRATMD